MAFSNIRYHSLSLYESNPFSLAGIKNVNIPKLSKKFYLVIVSTLILGLLLILGTHFSDKIIFALTSDVQPNCKSTLPDYFQPDTNSNNIILATNTNATTGNIDLRKATDPDSSSIPNIIHYVWLIKDRPNFLLDFRIFISVYSAYLYFQPDIIYIHTDATLEQFERAKKSSDESTRWTLAIPKVTFHHITVPLHTTTCRKILKVQHQSDFVRTAMLHEFGGVYMDTDIIPLRDIKPLRESGFANVMGLEEAGRVNNGFMMCKKASALISIYRVEQHRVFDNRWTTHSVDLLSEMSYRLGPIEKEVLILGMKNFSPSSWTKKDINTLFKPHFETAASLPYQKENHTAPEVLTTKKDAAEYWQARKKKSGKEPWEVDYSSSYVIHAFDGSPLRFWPSQVSLEYVLDRQSNYARAVYPAIQQAIDTGIIDRKDLRKVQ
jgi:mannosyltransferase OCH1-like enzyme